LEEIPVKRYLVLPILAILAVHFAALSAPPAELEGHKLVYHDDFEAGSGKWEMTDPKAWAVTGEPGAKALSLKESSDYSPPVRSPKSIAWLKEIQAGDFILDLRIKQTGREYGHRDACVFLGRQDASHFYYVHLATKADDHANSIFLVNGAPRVSIAKERTTGTQWSSEYHHVRIKRSVESGKIEVFFDDMSKPAMVAEDKTFGVGQIGVGSFDDSADFDDIALYTR